MPTPQQNAITSAQNLLLLGSQATTLLNGIVAWEADYAVNNWANYWTNMATVTVNADGSLATTNDSTPNTAHPINVPSVSPLLVSETTLVNLKTALATLQTAFIQAGGTVTLTAQAVATSCAQASPNTLG